MSQNLKSQDPQPRASERAPRFRWTSCALLSCVVVGLCFALGAGAQGPSEYQAKAAFLFNFAKFVEWPPGPFGDASDDFVICTLGEDPFEGALDAVVEGKSLNGHALTIRRLRRPENARDCQIVFIGSSENPHLRRIFDAIKGASVLTVGETREFAREGGIVKFTVQEDRLRLEINVDAAARAHVKFSSKLLSLAKILKD